MVKTRTTFSIDEIQQLVRRSVARFRPTRIILFGSQAYGEPHEDSDVDLLVVLRHPPSRHEAWRVAHELAPHLPVQLVFMSVEEFEESKDVVGGLAYPAHHWGQVLYGKNP